MVYRFYDFDETLALTKTALYRAYKKALAEYDITFDIDYFTDFIYVDATKYLKETCNFSEAEIAEIKSMKEAYYLDDFFDDIVWNWPDISLMDTYVIVTNTRKELVEKLLQEYDMRNMTNMAGVFKVIGAYSSNVTYKRKPDPELYEVAFQTYIQRMRKTDELHIYEDSPEGLLAAASFLNAFKKRISKFYLHHII